MTLGLSGLNECLWGDHRDNDLKKIDKCEVQRIFCYYSVIIVIAIVVIANVMMTLSRDCCDI